VPQQNLLIFGASTRAAAFSAIRAGLRPKCADLFADADLRARCPVQRLTANDYPRRFLDLIQREVAAPWMYTGGLENWSKLVAKMEQQRSLWGNGMPVLMRARSPWFVADLLCRADLPYLEVQRPGGERPCAGRWLVKPLEGAGGRGIDFWDGKQIGLRRVYLQRYVPGEPHAAVYLGDGRCARFLGLARQLVGETWLHAPSFHYCGSVGPVAIAPLPQAALEQLGNVLTEGCGLRGLFGVDGIVHAGTFWPVEINPRYPASVEVLEYATGLAALDLHRSVFESDTRPASKPRPSREVVGKAISFARDGLTFPADGPWSANLRSPIPVEEMPRFADVPQPGETLQAGRPVLTYFARGRSAEDCVGELRQTAAELQGWLYRRGR
jgi:predicted ATP-grasp superfamily ATP-dependent carboligase